MTTDNANYSSSGYSQTRDVGLYDANPWGFYDMHGNVREWISDAVTTYDSGAKTNPFYPGTVESFRILRGGSSHDPDTLLRSAHRINRTPTLSFHHIGFRVGLKKIPLGNAGSTYEADLNSTVGMEMIWVEPGTFTMGQAGVART